jgi:hypothetical protein
MSQIQVIQFSNVVNGFTSFVLKPVVIVVHILPFTTTTNTKMLANWFHTILEIHENELLFS